MNSTKLASFAFIVLVASVSMAANSTYIHTADLVNKPIQFGFASDIPLSKSSAPSAKKQEFGASLQLAEYADRNNYHPVRNKLVVRPKSFQGSCQISYPVLSSTNKANLPISKDDHSWTLRFLEKVQDTKSHVPFGKALGVPNPFIEKFELESVETKNKVFLSCVDSCFNSRDQAAKKQCQSTITYSTKQVLQRLGVKNLPQEKEYVRAAKAPKVPPKIEEPLRKGNVNQ